MTMDHFNVVISRLLFDCFYLTSPVHLSSFYLHHPSALFSLFTQVFRYLMMEDLPFFWDAWDVMIYSQYKFKYIDPPLSSVSCQVVTQSPLRGCLRYEFSLSASSSAVMEISLDC